MHTADDIRPVRPSDWPAIEALFGANGACGGCWCMYWRVPRGGRAWDEVRGHCARERFRDLIETGAAQGLLAFQAEQDRAPIGWLSLGPSRHFPRLHTVRALRGERTPDAWAVTCLYVGRRARRHGLGTRLLIAARQFAFQQGCDLLEGYPVNVRPGSNLPAAFAWTGVPAMFDAAGFERVDRPNETRGIWQASAP